MLGTLEEADGVEELGVEMEVRGSLKGWRVTMGFVRQKIVRGSKGPCKTNGFKIPLQTGGCL